MRRCCAPASHALFSITHLCGGGCIGGDGIALDFSNGHLIALFFADAKPFKYFVRSREHEIGPTVSVGTKLCVAKTISVNWLLMRYSKISLRAAYVHLCTLFSSNSQRTVSCFPSPKGPWKPTKRSTFLMCATGAQHYHSMVCKGGTGFGYFTGDLSGYLNLFNPICGNVC